MAAADVCFSGEKTTYVASATWYTPSAPWESSRTASRRRKFRKRSRTRRSRTMDMGPSLTHGEGPRADDPGTLNNPWQERSRYVSLAG
ncbi:hypothetical protein GCM10010365_49780 [Streptomyces poonensis]|uniref:Uncharacterized protein n=1 Tax=Streptomyces poonensis TaxID=68255 RepID=A0A918PWQ7_9ACTN|nr:hypothetical protein GCM10010365_49780 [Streptomyces poonensis]GLJ89863.1 hypothetical protein GCM10017589_24640 [Streptomyces poonensis]